MNLWLKNIQDKNRGSRGVIEQNEELRLNKNEEPRLNKNEEPRFYK